MLSHKQNILSSLMQKYPGTKGRRFRVLSSSLQIAFEKQGKEEGEKCVCVCVCFVWLVWKVCIALNSTPATCILVFIARFKAFGLVDLLGIQHAAAEKFALGLLKGWIRYLGMCGAGSAMVSGWALFTAKSACKPASAIYRYSDGRRGFGLHHAHSE